MSNKISPTSKSLLSVLLILTTMLLVACSGEDSTSTETVSDSGASTAITALSTGLLPHQEMAREFLRQLVEIDTTDSKGDNTRAYFEGQEFLYRLTKVLSAVTDGA